jgi:hypothetical protein
MNENFDASLTQNFKIEIEGHLAERRIKPFEDLHITHLADGRTLISGVVRDQAHLFGVLIHMRDLGVPLLSITFKKAKIINTEGEPK